MELEHNRDAGVLDIQVQGRVDSPSSGDFTAALEAVITAEDIAVVVDMGATEYINSVGLRALLGMAQQLKGRGAKFAIYSPVGPVMDVFQISGLDRVLAVHGAKDDAVASVSAS